VIALFALVLAGAAPAAYAQEVVTLRAWTIGPDTPAFYRAENLVLAAERLNKYLEAAGANVRVQVEADFWTETWDSYRRRAILAFESGDPNAIPDIINSSHLDIPTWASAGWIIPMDQYIERYWDGTFEDFFPHLWDSVTFAGQRWGVPQDIEVRMVFYRKDHLKALGWSDEAIADLPRRVRDKEFTLQDLVELGKQLRDAGISEWPIIHRPTAGPDFFQFIVAFGGEYVDPDTGKLILDRQAVLQTLNLFRTLTQEERLTPVGMTSWAWPTVHRSLVVDGEASVQITGGMWNWAEWQRDLGVTEDYLFENITFTLIPAGSPDGRPNQAGQPQAYMITQASRHKDLAALLIAVASDVDLNTNHALQGAKLAIRRSQTAFPTFAESTYLSMAATLVPDQIFLPAHEATGFYNTALYEAIGAVEAGMLRPEQALQELERRLRSQLGDDLIVR